MSGKIARYKRLLVELQWLKQFYRSQSLILHREEEKIISIIKKRVDRKLLVKHFSYGYYMEHQHLRHFPWTLARVCDTQMVRINEKLEYEEKLQIDRLTRNTKERDCLLWLITSTFKLYPEIATIICNYFLLDYLSLYRKIKVRKDKKLLGIGLTSLDVIKK